MRIANNPGGPIKKGICDSGALFEYPITKKESTASTPQFLAE